MTKKKFLFLTPELYLICASLYYWMLTSSLFNPIAMLLLAILTFQLIYKKPGTGLVIASLFLLLNLYMVLALVSELSKFIEVNNEFVQVLLLGGVYLGLNLIFSSIMLFKYVKMKNYSTIKEV